MADDASSLPADHRIGANGPPEASPFEAIKVHVDDLMTEARNWCDGAAIESQDQADTVARLIDEFRQAQKTADEARKEEARPHDEAKARVQEKYAPLLAETKAQTGVIPRALAALKATLTPWLQVKERERQAAEAVARAEAQRKADAAAAAARAADPANLDEVEAVEAKIGEAQNAQAEANRLGRDRAQAKGDGRAIGLRRTFTPVMNDRRAALNHYATTRADDLVAFLQRLAEADVREGRRQIPGFDVVEGAKV